LTRPRQVAYRSRDTQRPLTPERVFAFPRMPVNRASRLPLEKRRELRPTCQREWTVDFEFRTWVSLQGSPADCPVGDRHQAGTVSVEKSASTAKRRDIPVTLGHSAASVLSERIDTPRVTLDQPQPCPYCQTIADIEFDIEVDRYLCMRPGCRYKAALERRWFERRRVNSEPLGNDQRRTGA
jgi:hypothetical protein